MNQRRDLSLEEKIEILKSYDSLPRMSQREAATKLSISQSVLCKLLKNRKEFESSCVQNEQRGRKRKRHGKDADVEDALKMWFTSVRKQDTRVDRDALKLKAEEFARKMGKMDFIATDGWLSRWLSRENITYQKPQGEQGEADHVAAEAWIREEWPKLTTAYKPEDIYNADETSLYIRALPEHTYAFKNDKAMGVKTCKERITMLVCVSMTGERRELLAIGKFKKPRCFKNVQKLPVKYTFNKSAWMTSAIFIEYLLEWDAKLNHEILLLVDNCSAHKNLPNLEHIRVVFLPKNTTSLIQPCDQGIIRTLKAYYRKEMRLRILAQIDDELAENHASLKEGIACQTSRSNILAKKTSLLDALHLCAKAWTNVTVTTIRNCFKKGGFSAIESGEIIETESIEPPTGVSVELFQEWIDIDENVETCAATTDDDIINKFMEKKQEDEDEDGCEQDDALSAEQHVSNAEMRKALEILRQAVQQRADNFDLHYDYEEFINSLLKKHQRQTRIHEFLK